MAYFLKQSKFKKGTYLQIYESFRDPETKAVKHKSFKAIGYLDALIESGIENPIEYYQKEVDALNLDRRKRIELNKIRKVAEDPTKNLGHVLPKGVLNKLGVAKDIRYMNLMRDFSFDIYDIFEDLVCSRMVSPCSKLKTWEEIIPSLYVQHEYSLNQVYEAVEFIGSEYEKFIEVFNHHIAKVYGRKTSKVYFDCTNYYFEIDSEFEDKMKGPSKEKRNDPIIGMALMLDENQIPIGMKMYPGNESEKPKLRNMVKELKDRNQITGKTIQVADKGLNCSENIVSALLNKDGYIFSKSVKQLPKKEMDWVFLDNAKYVEVYEENESNGKPDKVLKYKYRECIDEFEYEVVTKDGKKKKVLLPEKRILTWNPELAKKQKHEIQRLMDKAVMLSSYNAKRSEYGDAAKYVNFVSIDKETGEVSSEDKVVAVINEKKFKDDMKFAGYNLLVTSETKMSAKEVYRVYHNLWRIEESFRILKSQLDARPVYLHKKESIYGHFLICYVAVLLLRLLQFNTFNGEISYNEILNFIQNFKCILDKKTAINISSLKLVKKIDDRLNLNFSNYFFSDKDIEKMLKSAF